MRLWHYSQREILGRPGRAILTLLSIVIGVGTAISVSLATNTTRTAYQSMFESVSGRTSLEIASQNGKKFDPSVVAVVEKVPGVESVMPIARRPSFLYMGDNDKRFSVTVAGMGFGDKAPPDFEIVEGRLPKDREEIVVSSSLAKGADIKLDDELTLRGARSTIKFTVVGLVKLPVSAHFSQSGGLFVTLDGVKRLMRLEFALDTISVMAKDKSSVKSLITEINKVLPEGLVARKPPGQSEAAEETMLSVEQGLKFASTLSMAMAAFIILNTFLMNVGERRRALAIMRAIGATRSQIIRMLLREGLLMGVLGTILGIPVGIFGARMLLRTMEGVLSAPGMKVALPPPQLSLSAVILAALLGPTVALIATFVPARKAGRISPLEGMSSVSQGDTEPFPKAIAISAVCTWFLALGLISGSIYNYLPTWVSIPAGVLMMISFVLTVPLILGPLAQFARWLGNPIMGVEGRLAERQLLRKRIRTTLTIGVLVVAISNGIGIGNSVITNIHDVRQWYKRAFMGEFFLSPITEGSDGFGADQSAALLKEIKKVPGIKQVQTVRWVRQTTVGAQNPNSAKDDKGYAQTVVRNFSEIDELPFEKSVGDPDVLRAKLKEGQAVIGSTLASKQNVKIGDELLINANGRGVKTRIAGLTNDYMAGGLVVYLDASAAQKQFGVEGADLLMVSADKATVADPAKLAATEAALTKICKSQDLLMRSLADLRLKLDGILGGVIGCFWGLLALGFIVASIGIVNTLTMNVLEQTRELGLLRVVGMTRGQVRKTMFCQAGLLALIGILLGAIGGIGTAYVINVGNEPLLGHPVAFTLDQTMVGLCFVGAFAVVLLAAWFPSERAARLDLAEALQYE